MSITLNCEMYEVEFQKPSVKDICRYILINVERDATQSNLFTILQVHSACFGCQPHPSTGVHKTVTTASGTGHIFCAATSIQRGQVERTCSIINRLLCIASRWAVINID